MALAVDRSWAWGGCEVALHPNPSPRGERGFGAGGDDEVLLRLVLHHGPPHVRRRGRGPESRWASRLPR